MRVLIYNDGCESLSFAHPNNRLRRLADGIRLCGDHVVVDRPQSVHELFDVVITWGMRHVQARQFGMHHLVAELGFLGDRMRNMYLGFDSLGDRGNFPVRFGVGTPWYVDENTTLCKGTQLDTKTALVIGQVQDDSAIYDFKWGDPKQRYCAWLRALRSRLISAGYRVAYRPHPKGSADAITHELGWDRISSGALSDEADKCALAVGYSSNAMLELACMAVPVVVASSLSFAYPLTSSLRGTRKFARGALHTCLDRAASAQWSDQELEDGTAWLHLREHVCKDE